MAPSCIGSTSAIWNAGRFDSQQATVSPWLTPKTGKARRPRRAVGCEGADTTPAAEDYSSLERVAAKFAGSMNADHPLVVPLGRRLVAAWIKSSG
jgi:hypothetical protein